MNYPATFKSTASNNTRQQLITENYQRRNGDAITGELRALINNLLDDQFRRDLHRIKNRVRSGYLAEQLWKAYL